MSEITNENIATLPETMLDVIESMTDTERDRVARAVTELSKKYSLERRKAETAELVAALVPVVEQAINKQLTEHENKSRAFNRRVLTAVASGCGQAYTELKKLFTNE